ncbi:MAG: DNA cytosine methyltransferase [Pirellulaceae bacterium]
MLKSDDALSVVDLFCGAGGLSIGFERAGFTVVNAIDNWEPAVATYRANVGNHVRKEAIHSALQLSPARVIVGGPPCQGFSSAGRRRDDDSRNSLVAVYADLVVKHRPDAFVFENVEGFLTGAGGRFVFELLEPVIAAGYRVHLQKVNAANYGVPQHRKRVVAIGGRGWDPTVPKPTHAAFGAPGAHLANGRLTAPAVTLSEAISKLPPPTLRDRATDDPDHTYAPLTGEDLLRAQLLSKGQRMRDLPEELWHDSYRRRAYRRVMDGTPTERRGGAPSGVRRLKGDEPSKAITGGSLRDFLHPEEDRVLTIRECATLQTFPETFRFHGTQADRIQLVGNAVPPHLAEVIARSLRLDLERQPTRNSSRGALLSFVPTLSTGMSPVLDDVARRVRQRFVGCANITEQRTLWV